MGSYTKIYKVQRRDITIQDIYNITQEIISQLIEGDKVKHTFSLKVRDINKVEQLVNNWRLDHNVLSLRFLTDEIANLNALVLMKECYTSAFYYTKSRGNVQPNLLGYSISVNTERNNVIVYISLSYSEGIESSNFDNLKQEVKKLLEYLISEKLIYIESNEVEIIVENLLRLSSSGMKGKWSYEDRVQLSSYGDFRPHNSAVNLPSNITLSFNEKYINWFKGIENIAVKMNSSLWNYFKTNNLLLSVQLISRQPPLLVENYKKLMNQKEIESTVSIDILKNPNFPLLQKLKAENKVYYEIRDFIWKGSDINNKINNRITMSKDSNGNLDFQIGLDQRINDEYYHTIEDIIFDELIFTNYN